MITRKLTDKQRGYCLSYVELNSQVGAYRANYAYKNQTEKTVHRNAGKVYAVPLVKAFIAELQAEARKRHDVTVDTISDELDAAITLAKKVDSPSSMVSGILGKARIHGLLKDDKTITIKRVDDMNEGELLEFLGGEPTDEELRKTLGNEKVGEA